MADTLKTQWPEQAISTINTLIETCKDGEYGFRSAAEAIQDPETQRLFNRYSEERRGFAAELQAVVHGAGREPEERGSVAGALHRGWINLKSAVTGKDEHAVLAAAETGEDSAVNAYKEALDHGELPAEVRPVVERQCARVKAAHDQVRALRDRG